MDLEIHPSASCRRFPSPSSDIVYGDTGILKQSGNDTINRKIKNGCHRDSHFSVYFNLESGFSFLTYDAKVAHVFVLWK